MSSNEHWMVEINGDAADLSELAQSVTGPDVSIIREGEKYGLTSRDFDAGLSAEAVREKAKGIASRLTGVACLALHATAPIQVGSVYRVRHDGTRDIHLFPETGVLHFRGFASTLVITREDGTVEESHPADPVSDWLLLAQKDQRVGLVLSIFATGDESWSNLYKVFEIIREDRNPVTAGWLTEPSRSRFTGTANSPGLDTRHGVQKKKQKKKPPPPMDISEARALIRAVVHAWLRDKSSSATP